mmetsp:Transcript_16890/g.21844  ORF Transcript_16890/g.21844 Transcript_16890/m.21844 type:complete len:229 (+) Transcript_16890:1-687(+)
MAVYSFRNVIFVLENRVLFRRVDRAIPERFIIVTDKCVVEMPTCEDCSDTENSEWNEHHQWRLMRITMVMVMTVIIIVGMRFVMMHFGTRAVECHIDQAPRVEAGQQRRDNTEPEGKLSEWNAVHASRIGRFNDRVFREEAGEAPNVRHTETDNRNRTDHHRAIGERHILGEAAHVSHILLVVRAMNNRTSTEEEQRLEEGVREQVEHRCLIGADACGKEHVTKLRTG